MDVSRVPCGHVCGACLITSSPEEKEKPGFIASANLHGVNAPTMADSELPRYTWTEERRTRPRAGAVGISMPLL